MFVVCCLLLVACCLTRSARCLLLVVVCVMHVARYSLIVVCCLLFDDCLFFAFLFVRCWLWALGLLIVGCRVFGGWVLGVGCWMRVVDFVLLLISARCLLFVACVHCLMLDVGCLLWVVACCWLLVVGL